jgi:Sulfotransferase family
LNTEPPHIVGQQDDLPNLLVIGAMRSGTTTAYYALREHPEIFMAPWKEPHFLALDGVPAFSGPGDEVMNRNAVVTESTYRELFREGRGIRWRGEASATYLYLPNSIPRIQRYLDSPTMLVFLRDPVDRAFSAYRYMRGQNREPLADFAEALAVEGERRAAGWGPMWHYDEASHYKPQLERLFSAFPRDRIRIVLFDDLQSRPDEVFQSLFAWLGVNSDHEVSASAHNRSGPARSRALNSLLRPSRLRQRIGRRLPEAVKRPLRHVREANRQPTQTELEPKVRKSLVTGFMEDIEYVELLTERDLSAWRRS